MADFKNLKTERFRLRMRPAAERLYKEIFTGCEVEDLRENGARVHVLDQEFGIDTLLRFGSGQWLSIQEKYRSQWFLENRRYRVRKECPDFTQEYKNGVGTQHEGDGEWFHLGAQLYFYGWANKQENGFAAWVLLDIAKYKLLVRQRGGLKAIGKRRVNRKHGRASFYCIPVLDLQPAFVISHLPDKYLGAPRSNPSLPF